MMKYLLTLLFMSCSYVWSENISLGSIVPLAREGKLATRGLQAAINRYNNNSLAKHTVSLQVRDDDGDLARGQRQLTALMPDTKLFFSILTHGLAAQTKPVREKENLLFWGAVENGADVQDRSDATMVHLRPSLERELDALIHHAIQVKKKRTFAIFYESSQWGELGMQYATKIFSEYAKKYPSLSVAQVQKYQKQTVEIDRAMHKIIEARPEMVLCISGRRATYHFIQKSLRKGLIHARFMGPSRLLPLQSHLRKTRGLNLLVTSSLPHAHYSDMAIAQQYRDDMDLYYGSEHARYHAVSFASYVQMRFFLRLLDMIDGSYTHQKLWHQIEKLKNYNFEGLNSSFDPDRNAIDWGLWLSSGDTKTWRRIS